MFFNLRWIWSKKPSASSFYTENNFKPCLTKLLLNMFKLWCERGISYLFNIVFLVAVPCYSICRTMHFVAGGRFRVSIFSPLCCHCTNWVHCTHINLKIVCSVCFCLWTPRSISPVPIQPAIVWMIDTTEVCACRHSGIWYFVSVLYTNSSTY